MVSQIYMYSHVHGYLLFKKKEYLKISFLIISFLTIWIKHPLRRPPPQKKRIEHVIQNVIFFSK